MLRLAGYHLARRLVWKRAWRDGVPGVFEAFRTTTEHLAGQIRHWELQEQFDEVSHYADLDRDIEVLGTNEAGDGTGDTGDAK